MSDAPESILVGSIQKFSVEDGPGIRTTVFVKGCPLNCKWCHNPELIRRQQQLILSPNNCIGCGYCVKTCPQGAVKMSPNEGVAIDRVKCNVCLMCADQCHAQALRPVGKLMTIEEILRIAAQDKGFYDNTNGGITVSGGEILMHAKLISKLVDEAGKSGINVCLDTCGYGDPRALMEMAIKGNVTDILYDMKAVDDEVHMAYTGCSNQLIIDNLKMLAADEKTADKLIMRMPLIKGVNDSNEIIQRTGELYREIGVKRVTLLPYHSLGISKERNVGGAQEEFEQPTEARLTEIQVYFQKGLNLDVEVLGKL